MQIIEAGIATKRVVYTVLRQYRPKRKRAPRMRLSLRRSAALGMHAEGMAVARIAELLGCHKVRIYKFLEEERRDAANKATRAARPE